MTSTNPHANAMSGAISGANPGASRAGSVPAPAAGATRAVRTPRRRDRAEERGITTAEYAVGTAAGAGLAGLLYQLLTGGFGDRLLKTLFEHVLGLLGIG